MRKSQLVPWIPRHRNWKDETLNMATAAGAGLLVGSLIGGKKGATIGAVSGGFARWLRWWVAR